MAGEHFLSYYLYYAAPMVLSMFTRSVAKPVLVSIVFFHLFVYGLSINATKGGAARTADSEYRFWLPLTALVGTYSGYAIAQVLNFRRLVFFARKFIKDHGCWMFFVLPFQLVMLGATFVIWEMEGFLTRPISYAIALFCQLTFIPLAWYAWKKQPVFAYRKDGGDAIYWDDDAAHKFYGSLALYLCSTTTIFGIVRWVAPNFWPFWLVPAVACVHALFTSMIGVCISSPNESANTLFGLSTATVLQQAGLSVDAYLPNPTAATQEMGLLAKEV